MNGDFKFGVNANRKVGNEFEREDHRNFEREYRRNSGSPNTHHEMGQCQAMESMEISNEFNIGVPFTDRHSVGFDERPVVKSTLSCCRKDDGSAKALLDFDAG